MAFFKNRSSAASESASSGKAEEVSRVEVPVQSADDLRRRARHRLIGSAILVVAAVIVLPLVLDSSPRTVSPGIPISLGGKTDTPAAPVPAASGMVETSRSLAANEQVVEASPAASAASSASEPDAASEPAASAAALPPVAAASRAPHAAAPHHGLAALPAAGLHAPPTRQAQAPVVRADDEVTASRLQADAERKARLERQAREQAQQHRQLLERQKQEKAAKAAKARADAERRARQQQLQAQKARAASEAAQAHASEKAAYSKFPEKGRFVVQVGAYVEPGRIASVRNRLSAAGLSNYTQVVKVNGKDVTRVRMGPFGSRQQMEHVAAKVRALGLPVSMYSY